MWHPSRRIVLLFLVLAACGTASPAWGDLIQNGGFDTPTPGLSPPNYPTSISGAGVFGAASADQWTLFNSRDATTSTELLPTTAPSGSGLMLHLTTVTNTTDPLGSFFNNVQQVFPTQSGPTIASVDVFVLSGPVALGLFTGFGGTAILPFAISTTTNQWETLTVTVPAGMNPNLIAIISESVSGTGEFYIDNARVAAVPEPASGLLALIGMSAAALWFRKTHSQRGRRRAEP